MSVCAEPFPPPVAPVLPRLSIVQRQHDQYILVLTAAMPSFIYPSRASSVPRLNSQVSVLSSLRPQSLPGRPADAVGRY